MIRTHPDSPTLRLSFVLSAWLCIASLAGADDWPQFRGPRRDGTSAETDLAAGWPSSGPPVVWKVPLGGGFSSITVADGRLFTLFSDREDEMLGAFDAATGREIWRRRLDGAYRNQFGSGPRSTPTVDGSVVFALGARGVLVAVDAATGASRWQRDLKDELGARVPEWGISTSPLVEGDLLILDVGGRSGRSVAALDKHDGATVWTSQDDKAGYSSPIAVDIGGRRQIVSMTGTQIVGLDPTDGALIWRLPWKTQYDVNAATPIHIEPDLVFVSSGYGVGGALLRIRQTGAKAELNEVWRTRGLKNQFSSSVLVDGHLYGFDDSIFKSLRVADGGENWKARGFGHGSLIFADGRLIVLGERGKLSLVEATPEAFREIASTQLFSAKAWTPPSLADGRLYVRNEREMMALDLSGR
jgi:outer membrane protein assembly factor BamB